MDREATETLRTAIGLLRRYDGADDWIVPMLLDRIEAAEAQAAALLSTAVDLMEDNRELRRERDHLQATLSMAKG